MTDSNRPPDQFRTTYRAPRDQSRPTYRMPTSRRRWPRRVLVGANIVVAVCILGAASAYGYVQWRLGQIHHQKVSTLTTANGGKPFTLLIVGSDSRTALSKSADNAQFGGSSATPGQRSDTIILARIAPATRQVMLLSLPRDLWVDIPGMGPNRINAAFDSGPSLLVRTIQDDLHIPVNHFLEVNFDTFRDITNAVGGVSFYFPTPARDTYSLLKVTQPGCVLLTGDQALGFVRSRHYEYYLDGYWHSEAESDLARIQRQQAFIKKMLKKAETEYTNPLALSNVIGGVTKNLTVDNGFSNNLLLNLAVDFRSLNPAAIQTLTLPNYGYTTSGGAEVLGLQQPQADQTIAAFNAFGNPPPGSSTAKATPSTTLAPAAVTVAVANGTGVGGQAGQVTTLLQNAGFTASTLDRSPGYGHDTTLVLYNPKYEQAAHQVEAAIPGGGTLEASPSLASGRFMVEVVTGTTYTTASAGGLGSGTSATGGGSSSTAAPTTTTTTLPGTNAVTYVLPGMPAGQVPPNCGS